MTNKNDLRRYLKDQLHLLSLADAAKKSEQIYERILSKECWQVAHTVALFASIPHEPQIQPIIEMAWQAGKTVLLPRVKDEQTLDLHKVRGWSDLVSGSFGISEPKVDATEVVAPELVELILVPGLGFDRSGTRIGRGAGLYDRLLPKLKSWATRIGVFYGCQELAHIPRERWDSTLPFIITEQETIISTG
jgi:5-formyltetrahydrofolate cyclo-ligase